MFAVMPERISVGLVVAVDAFLFLQQGQLNAEVQYGDPLDIQGFFGYVPVKNFLCQIQHASYLFLLPVYEGRENRVRKNLEKMFTFTN